jgi:hypothetical protein
VARIGLLYSNLIINFMNIRILKLLLFFFFFFFRIDTTLLEVGLSLSTAPQIRIDLYKFIQ